MNRDRFLWVKAAVILATIALVVASCKKEEKEYYAGFVKVVKGKAKLIRGEKKTKIKIGDKISEGDIIKTGKKSTVIAYFGSENVKAEIQPNSKFVVEKHTDEHKHFHIEKGNAWFQAIKSKKGESIRLHSPTAVAGVRGTKFFMFQFPDGISGTCHCEGDVHFESKKHKGKKYKEVHSTDMIVFHKGHKTVVLTPKELEFMGDAAHRHSKLDDSPLGPPDDVDPKIVAKVMKLVEAKFKKAK